MSLFQISVIKKLSLAKINIPCYCSFMKKVISWFHEHWFKIGILLVLMIITCSVLYFFVFFLPQNERVKAEIISQEKLLTQTAKCKDAGLKAFKEDGVRYGIQNMFEPTFAYNARLNTCLYSGGYSDDDATSGQCGDILKHSCKSYWERWVKNSYTNNLVASVVNSTNEKGEWITSAEVVNKFWEDQKFFMEE